MNKKILSLALFFGFILSTVFGDSFTEVNNGSESRVVRYGSTWVDTNIKGHSKLLVMGVYNGLYILGSNKLDCMYLCTITLDRKENKKTNTKNLDPEKVDPKKINTKNDPIIYELKAVWNGNTENRLEFKDKSEISDFKKQWNEYTLVKDNKVGFDIYEPNDCSEQSYFCRAVIYNHPDANKTLFYLSGASGAGKNAYLKCYEIQYEPVTENAPGSPLKAGLVRNPQYDINTPNSYVIDMDVIDLGGSIADEAGDFSKNHTVYPLLVMFGRESLKDPIEGNCTDGFKRKCIAGDHILIYDGMNQTAKTVVKDWDKLPGTMNDLAMGYPGMRTGRNISGPGMLYITKEGALNYAFFRSHWKIYNNGMLSYGMEYYNTLLTVPLTITDMSSGKHTLKLTDKVTERSYTQYNDKGFVTPACIGPRVVEFSNFQILKLLDPNRVNFARIVKDNGEMGWTPKIDIEDKVPSDRFTLKKSEYTSIPIYLSESELAEMNKNKEIVPASILPKWGGKDFMENYNPQYSIATIVYGWPYSRLHAEEPKYFPSINHNNSDGVYIDYEEMKGTTGDVEAGFISAGDWGPAGKYKFFIGGKGSWDVTWKKKVTNYKLDAHNLVVDGSGSGAKADVYGKFGSVIFTKEEGDIFSVAKLIPISKEFKSTKFSEPTPYILGTDIKKDITRPVVIVSAARYVYPSGLSIMPFDVTDPASGVTRQKGYSVFTDGLGISDNADHAKLPERPSSFISVNPDDTKESIQAKMDKIYAWQKAVGFSQLFELVKIEKSGVKRVSPKNDGKDGRWFRYNSNSADKDEYTMKNSLTTTNSTSSSGAGGLLSEGSFEAVAGFKYKIYLGGKGGVTNSETNVKDSGITLKIINDVTASNPFNSDVYRFVIDVTEYKNYLAREGKKVTRPWFIPKFAWLHNDKYYLIIPYLPADTWNTGRRI